MNRRLALLDGLRLVAALMVVLYHYTAWNHGNWGDEGARETWPGLSQLTVFGNLGVPLFFVISGFVILLSSYGKRPAKFIGSRIGRLFPAYWVAVIATGALLFFMWPGAGDDFTYGDWAMNLTMIQSAFDVKSIDGVYWTLWVEMRFYAWILALMLLGWLTPGRILAFAALWPAAGIFAEALGLSFLEDAMLKQHAPLFAGGMVLFLIYRFGHTPLRWIILGTNVALSAYFTGIRLSGEVDWLVGYEIAPEAYWPMVVAVFALLAVVTLTPAVNLNVPGLAVAGALTYPVYLLHQMWGWWGIGILSDYLPQSATLAVVMLVVLGAAYAVHRWVERPLGRPLAGAVTRGVDLSGAWLSGAAAALRPALLRRTG
ncbi:acyltransferase family protein [Zhihengliuella halotolerans]|uniref:Peptidoglycan/LPS O-acetylase OafA/YrhL n=1 Tax=Zhihengliuella halotolerans TaxID=370736 RepID=A0A4Q8A9N8_9MICC|nr:acyltransferase [Zhihengliuella halotolerans]RZU60748.1 peptidoglycan/LPS O-acetylase OafA/YrhL [Zhihengliuella halotolerans]